MTMLNVNFRAKSLIIVSKYCCSVINSRVDFSISSINNSWLCRIHFFFKLYILMSEIICHFFIFFFETSIFFFLFFLQTWLVFWSTFELLIISNSFWKNATTRNRHNRRIFDCERVDYIYMWDEIVSSQDEDSWSDLQWICQTM